MRRVLLSLTVVGSCLLGSQAFAEEGSPSATTLSAMGLSGMQLMSDNDALAIRGKGYRFHGPRVATDAWGQSSAGVGTPIGGSSASNGYNARGFRAAGGNTDSIAGTTLNVNIRTRSRGNVTIKQLSITNTYYAGGASSSYAR